MSAEEKDKSATPSSQSRSQALSFDSISKCFSLPLAEAAAQLGVCTSVLKRICRKNGLDWWPYRKILSGKSIEDIKAYAAKEKHKEVPWQSKIIIGKGGSQQQNNEMSKSQGIGNQNLEQQGSATAQMRHPQNLRNINLMKGFITTSDEFRFGFPSSGLSTSSNKWWGSSSCPDRDGTENEENDEKEEHQCENAEIEKEEEEEEGKSLRAKREIELEGTRLLVAVRKKAVEEGRRVLKFGVFRGHGNNKLGKRDKILLLQIFKSSFPIELMNSSS